MFLCAFLWCLCVHLRVLFICIRGGGGGGGRFRGHFMAVLCAF